MNYFTETVTDELPVLYRDEYLIAVYKPAGLLVHRSYLDSEETQFAMQIVRDQIGQYVYPVHRLDKPTSGILLFALSSQVASLMMPMFANGEVDKYYEAIVRGYILDRQWLDYALVNEETQPQTKQNAVTEYWPLAQVEWPIATGRYTTSRYTWLGISPKTGRRRQIRRHMHHISHPIIGDTSHGDGRHNRIFRSQGWPGLWLLAKQLKLVHPITGALLDIELDYPARWAHMQAQFSVSV